MKKRMFVLNFIFILLLVGCSQSDKQSEVVNDNTLIPFNSSSATKVDDSEITVSKTSLMENERAVIFKDGEPVLALTMDKLIGVPFRSSKTAYESLELKYKLENIGWPYTYPGLNSFIVLVSEDGNGAEVNPESIQTEVPKDVAAGEEVEVTQKYGFFNHINQEEKVKVRYYYVTDLDGTWQEPRPYIEFEISVEDQS